MLITIYCERNFAGAQPGSPLWSPLARSRIVYVSCNPDSLVEDRTDGERERGVSPVERERERGVRPDVYVKRSLADLSRTAESEDVVKLTMPSESDEELAAAAALRPFFSHVACRSRSRSSRRRCRGDRFAKPRLDAQDPFIPLRAVAVVHGPALPWLSEDP